MKLLVLSDVHANWPALDAVARAEPDWDELVFCGDAVDYGPHPVECVRWLRANATHAVRGNHDNALAFDQDCRCMGSFRPYSLATRAWHRTLLGADEVQYLRDLFTIDLFERRGLHFRVTAQAQFHVFRLVSARDALYNSSGVPLRVDSTGQAGTDVGQELDLTANLHVASYQDVFVGFSHLFAGSFIRRTGPAVSPSLFYLQYSLKF